MIRIKICGITNVEFLQQAQKLDINAIGLMFYQLSKRNISIEMAQKLVKNIAPFIQITAVFVNPSPELVQRVLVSLPIHILQFHGSETENFCQSFQRPYIKAISLSNLSDFKKYENQYKTASAFLLDSCSGGSGKPFDWDLIPQDTLKPIIIAGGINSDNVSHLIEKHNIEAIDLSSGIEDGQNNKSIKKLNKLIKAVRKVNDKL